MNISCPVHFCCGSGGGSLLLVGKFTTIRCVSCIWQTLCSEIVHTQIPWLLSLTRRLVNHTSATFGLLTGTSRQQGSKDSSSSWLIHKRWVTLWVVWHKTLPRSCMHMYSTHVNTKHFYSYQGLLTFVCVVNFMQKAKINFRLEAVASQRLKEPLVCR